jgi:hypothetical protein
MVSANTLLLHLFRTLSALGRSFSAGDLAVRDDALDPSVLDSLLDAGGTHNFESDWGELVLRIPLENQCPCGSCREAAVPKRAILFRKKMGYVQIKLRPLASDSIVGLLDMMWRALGVEDHCVPGCANRSVSCPYSRDAYDRETYAKLFEKKPDVLAEALQELSRYNSSARVGNEFFIPTAVALLAAGGETI